MALSGIQNHPWSPVVCKLLHKHTCSDRKAWSQYIATVIYTHFPTILSQLNSMICFTCYKDADIHWQWNNDTIYTYTHARAHTHTHTYKATEGFPKSVHLLQSIVFWIKCTSPTWFTGQIKDPGGGNTDDVVLVWIKLRILRLL